MATMKMVDENNNESGAELFHKQNETEQKHQAAMKEKRKVALIVMLVIG